MFPPFLMLERAAPEALETENEEQEVADVRTAKAEAQARMASRIEQGLAQGSKQFREWMLAHTTTSRATVLDRRSDRGAEPSRDVLWRQGGSAERAMPLPPPMGSPRPTERPVSGARVAHGTGRGDRQVLMARMAAVAEEEQRALGVLAERAAQAAVDLVQAQRREAAWWDTYQESKARTQVVLAQLAVEEARREAERLRRRELERIERLEAERKRKAEIERAAKAKRAQDKAAKVTRR